MFVCFAPPEGAYGSTFNKFVAWCTGGRFCHVAIVFEVPRFPGGPASFVECSIVSTGAHNIDVVRLSEVEDMRGWTCFRLQLNDPACEIEAYNYVFHHMRECVYSTPESLMEASSCCFPCATEERVKRYAGGKTYCSKLAIEILHKTGQFLKRSAVGVTPNDIYRLIQGSTDKTGKWTDVTPSVDTIFKQKYTEPRLYVYTSPGNQDMMAF